MKGIILAGGTGSRLWPITQVISKQLLPLYDKPLIYYPLTTLMRLGIREILIITTPRDSATFKLLLGDGSQFGVSIQFEIQSKPEGLAHAFIIGEHFLQNQSCTLILGDNFFHWDDSRPLKIADISFEGGLIYGYKVSNPNLYGVVEVDSTGKPVSVEEKPTSAKSNIAITGLYTFDAKVSDIAKEMKPSQRGELEITSVIDCYLQNSQLELEILPEGTVWLDTGTPDSLLDAASYVQIIERRTGKKISCPEEVALRCGWIDESDILELLRKYGSNLYSEYLKRLLA